MHSHVSHEYILQVEVLKFLQNMDKENVGDKALIHQICQNVPWSNICTMGYNGSFTSS